MYFEMQYLSIIYLVIARYLSQVIDPNIFLNPKAQNIKQSDCRVISNKWFASDLSSVIQNNLCKLIGLTLSF